MRVTKAIREFIEQQVEIKAKQALVPLEKKCDEAVANAEADIVKAEAEMNAMFKTILDKYGVKKEHLCVRCPDLKYYLPEVDELQEQRHRIWDKKKSITTEIIAEMELGGTKAELMEKIANIKF
jgi:hypothetical protein